MTSRREDGERVGGEGGVKAGLAIAETVVAEVRNGAAVRDGG